MSQISVSHLSFSYDTSAEPIFSDVTFELDTDWKLGLIGRNGRGKTTFLNLLLGKLPYSGTITTSVSFEYFPFPVANPTLCATWSKIWSLPFGGGNGRWNAFSPTRMRTP